MTEPRPLLKVSQVADRLAVNLSHTYHLLRTGKIPGRVKVGGSVRVDEAVFEQWLEEQRRTSDAAEE